MTSGFGKLEQDCEFKLDWIRVRLSEKEITKALPVKSSQAME